MADSTVQFRRSKRVGLLKSFVALGIAALIFAPTSGNTQSVPQSQGEAAAAQVLRIDSNYRVGELAVPLNKSTLIRVDRSFTELSVGNPEIAQVIPLTRRSIYILGKKVGTTNLTISDGRGRIHAVVDLAVTYDIEGLKAKLYEIMPGEVIEVRPAGSKIVLTGQVSDAGKLQKAMEMATNYAGGAVTNMLTIGGSQQVMLQVRFAEVRRSALKELGISSSTKVTDGNNNYSFGTGSSSISSVANSFASAGASILTGKYDITLLVDALEQKGLVRTLAEPNIIALSGDTASFLAGGEFPIPVAQDSDEGSSTITVEFKPFGVGLSFTPTVIGSELINLEVQTEVSAIDPSVSVLTDNFRIPGLRVRRADTTVELLDGQGFAIAGLIQDDFSDGINQVPGLGNLPIIGALLRSSDFQRQQTELVIFITAHLVQPTTATALILPTDSTLPPSHIDFFLMGNLKGKKLTKGAGGIDGSYGYILP